MQKISTTKKGDCLRDRVYELLVGLKKYNCNKEYFVGGKKADIYYEEIDKFGERIRCVIECKNYNKSLTNTDLKKIISDYFLEKSKFDWLFIFTEKANDLSSQMKETLKLNSFVKIFSFSDFYSLIIDFRGYLQSSMLRFKEEGLDRYYVPLQDVEGNDLFSEIGDWIEEKMSPPKALIAEYGMGKTSFSLCLVEKYARAFIGGEIGRIPIYVRLGDMVDKVSIESLICTMFTSEFPVENFTYPVFREVNKQGYLLIILDGFDEMKHAMTVCAFREMFVEICGLVEGNSKILILGRPDAFLSESEQKSVLHGFDDVGGVEIKDPSLASFDSIKIRTFDRGQVEIFLRRYLAYLQSSEQGLDDFRRSKEFFDKRLTELLSDSYSELISRPVHAKMLVKLCISTSQNLNIFRRFHLYKKFIEMFLDREMGKSARKKVGGHIRLEFMQDVAWRLWKDGGRRSFSSKELNGWEREYFDESELSRNVDMLRELITGSVLERKHQDYFYFSHRSFQEYLVASHLLSKGVFSDSDVRDIANGVNDEILDFIVEGDKDGAFFYKLYDALSYFDGLLPSRLISFLAGHPAIHNCREGNIFSNGSPWNIFVCAILMDDGVLADLCDTDVANSSDQEKLNYLSCLLAYLCRSSRPNVPTKIATNVVAILHIICFREIENIRINKGKVTAGVVTESQVVRSVFNIMMSSISPILDAGYIEARSLAVSLSTLVDEFEKSLSKKMLFEDAYFNDIHSSTNDVVVVSVEDVGSTVKRYGHLFQKEDDAEEFRGYLKKLRRLWGADLKSSALVKVESVKTQSRRKLSLTNTK